LGSDATSADTKMLRLLAVNGMMLAPSTRSTACDRERSAQSHKRKRGHKSDQD
jgi:hypothetical protein